MSSEIDLFVEDVADQLLAADAYHQMQDHLMAVLLEQAKKRRRVQSSRKALRRATITCK